PLSVGRRRAAARRRWPGLEARRFRARRDTSERIGSAQSGRVAVAVFQDRRDGEVLVSQTELSEEASLQMQGMGWIFSGTAPMSKGFRSGRVRQRRRG